MLSPHRCFLSFLNLFGGEQRSAEGKAAASDGGRRRPRRVRRQLVFAIVSSGLLTFLLPYFPANLLHLFSQSAPLKVASGELPVLNDSEPYHFANIPISGQRPANQFIDADADLNRVLGGNPLSQGEHKKPILSVITVTKNPRPVFEETAAFVRQQSLRNIRWIIINDHTDSPKSYRRLQHARARDPRVVIFNNTRARGVANARTFAVDRLQHRPTKYFSFLDDDDLFELNALEKCVWMLESNANVSMCGSYVVGFGEKNYTWTRSFHNTASVYLNSNPLAGSEMMRTELLNSTGCVFDDKLSAGMEDWDFYLCVASHGKWGATIPEFLLWYRQNPVDLRKNRWANLFQQRENATQFIRGRWTSLEENFPDVPTRRAEVFEEILTTSPFKNPLSLEKSVLMIIPWMAIGGADFANLNLVRELSENGYRVTIVCTLLDVHGSSMVSRPYFMQYTHDIFVIPGMIRLSDAPRFLSYLIESRRSQLVIISNSQLGYGVLPWLSWKHDKVRFIDYVHNEEREWKNGGYATFSTVHQSSLDCTFTSSERARQFMIESGHSPQFVEVGYLGVTVQKYMTYPPDERSRVRAKLGIPGEAVVVTYLARMVDHKRPRLVLDAFLKVVERERLRRRGQAERLLLLLIGDGPKLGELEGVAKDSEANIQFTGKVSHEDAIDYIATSDIFCLPSLSEGIPFAVAEAMALGVAPLVSDAGGLPELIGVDGVNGVMVACNGSAEADTAAFAKKMYSLAVNAEWRRGIGVRARRRLQTMFDAKRLIPALVRRMLDVPRRRATRWGQPDTAGLYYAQENVLAELRVYSDFHETQRALQGKERGPYGSRYRATCGEYSESMTKLIDHLEEPSTCHKGVKLDVKALRSFALAQCGQWCIMNLRDRRRQSGWQMSEGCGFVVFDDEAHDCTQWYEKQTADKAQSDSRM